jgi:hypothetical protein
MSNQMDSSGHKVAELVIDALASASAANRPRRSRARASVRLSLYVGETRDLERCPAAIVDAGAHPALYEVVASELALEPALRPTVAGRCRGPLATVAGRPVRSGGRGGTAGGRCLGPRRGRARPARPPQRDGQRFESDGRRREPDEATDDGN